MKLSAPAKVNFHLRVLNRRPDGFHEIETLMAPLSLADEVTLEIGDGEGIEVACSDASLPRGEDNLAGKAVRAFQAATGRKFSTRIHIRKNIPSGAGLAGGSSDAATVLRGLDAALETGLAIEAIEKIAATLGSDIAFFARARAAICRGRGEIIEPVDLPETFPLLLLKPNFPVETPWAYKRWKESRELPGVDYSAQALGELTIVNDLERPVFEKFLLLPVIKNWLRSQPEVRCAAMSGSGSTMFAVLNSMDHAGDLEARARNEFGDEIWTASCTTI